MSVTINLGRKKVTILYLDEEDAAVSGGWRINEEGKVVWSNVAERLLGREHTTEDIPWEWVHPDDRPRTKTEWDAAFRLQTRFKMRFRLERADGSYVEVFHEGRPVFSKEDGEFRGFKGTTELVKK